MNELKCDKMVPIHINDSNYKPVKIISIEHIVKKLPTVELTIFLWQIIRRFKSCFFDSYRLNYFLKTLVCDITS